MAYRSDVVITVEGAAFYEFQATLLKTCKVFNLFDSKNEGAHTGVYSVKRIVWWNYDLEIDAIEKFITRYAKKGLASLYRDGDESDDLEQIGEHKDVSFKTSLYIDGDNYESGICVAIGEPIKNDFKDFLIENISLKQIFNEASINSKDETDLYYFRLIDEFNYDLVAEFLRQKKDSTYCIFSDIYSDKNIGLEDYYDIGMSTFIQNNVNVHQDPLPYKGRHSVLVNAIQNEWTQDAQDYLDLIDANATYESRRTFIMHAARCGNIVAYNSLLNNGASPNKQNKFGTSALSEAVFANDTTMIRHVLKDEDINRNRAFIVDLLIDRPHFVKLFMEYGFDVNSVSSTQTNLLIKNINDLSVIEQLVQQEDLDVHYKDYDGKTAKDYAKKSSWAYLEKLLLGKSVSANEQSLSLSL